jgi:hypothetical protein
MERNLAKLESKEAGSKDFLKKSDKDSVTGAERTVDEGVEEGRAI